MIIRENQIYFFIFLIGYGIYGAGITVKNNLDLFYLLSPIAFFLSIFLFKKENEIIFDFKGKISIFFKSRELIYSAFIFIVLFLLAYQRLLLSIADDEYAYASLGLVHSNVIITKISNYELLRELKVHQIYHLVSLFIVLGAGFYFYLLKILFEKKVFLQVAILILTVIFLRYFIFRFGGNPFAHPPFAGISSLISGAIFGLTDLSLKFIPFLVYNLFAIYYFFKLIKFNNKLISFLIVISLFSIPGILYIGTAVEQSLYSLICFSIISIELINNNKPNYKKLIIIILIFSFFRILSIVSISLIFFHILFVSKSYEDFFKNTYSVIKKTYPLLLLIPFIIFTFTSQSEITVDRVGLEFFDKFFFINTLPKIMLDAYTIFPGILTIFFIIMLFFFWRKSLFLILFCILNIFVYGTVMSQDNKYVYEVFFPILLSSILIYFLFIENKFIKKLMITFVILISFSNILILKKFNSLCLYGGNSLSEEHAYIYKYGCKIIYNHPFDLSNSYSFLKKHEKFNFENLYVPGVYYGLLPSIIGGMKVSEYKEHREINVEQNRLNILNKISWISADAKNINKDRRINFVLVADLANSQKLIKDLLNFGWKKIHTNKNIHFNTESIILFKKQ
tara:strand:- start:3322 stop:5187 length:1866 start_codon:yes stop_codon:yes gene_type:complete